MAVPHMQRRHRVSVEVERLARGIIDRHVSQSKDERRLALDEHGRVRLRIGARPAELASGGEMWLVNHIRVPRHWFTSAHATAAAYYGDYERACTLYIEAAIGALADVSLEADGARERQVPDEFAAAHRILVQHVAPAYVVAGAVDALAKMLHSLSAHANIVAGWKEGGGLYLEYHRVKAVLHDATQEDRLRERQALAGLTRRIQRLRQSKLQEHAEGHDSTAGEGTDSLVQRAALRIMLDDCQTLEAKTGGTGNAGSGREMEGVDRHDVALG